MPEEMDLQTIGIDVSRVPDRETPANGRRPRKRQSDGLGVDAVRDGRRRRRVDRAQERGPVEDLSMIRVFGVQIAESDCTTLVEFLNTAGRPEHVAAAAAIERGLNPRFVSLTLAQRAAILGVLDDPPEGLAQLRTELLKDPDSRNA